MVKVRSRQHYPRCANSDVVANSSKTRQSPSASIAPGPFVLIPPSFGEDGMAPVSEAVARTLIVASIGMVSLGRHCDERSIASVNNDEAKEAGDLYDVILACDEDGASSWTRER